MEYRKGELGQKLRVHNFWEKIGEAEKKRRRG